MIDTLLRLSEDKNSLCVHLPEHIELEDSYQPEDVVNALPLFEAGGFYVVEEAVADLLAAIKAGEFDSIESLTVAERRDTLVSVVMDDDQMSASIHVTGAYGGNPPTGNLLLALLAEYRITKGVNKKALKMVLDKSKTLAPGEEKTFEVARGKPAQAGANSTFVALVDDVRERVLRPQGDEDGQVDMRDLGDITTIAEGTPVMKRIQATKGVDGMSVTGNVLQAENGKEVPFKLNNGTAVSEDDANVLIATMAGLPWIHEDGIEIDDSLTMKSVDVGTGHVKFKGSIIIEGDVSPGMKVEAEGNVMVGGFVESALIKAGGDIVVMKGIIGHQVEEDEPMSCKLEAGNNITAKFSQYAELKAGLDIKLTLHAMHCRISCSGSLVVMDATEKSGTLSGGTIEVTKAITTVNLGSLAGTHTTVSAFTDYNEHREALSVCQKAYDEEQQQLAKAVEAELKLTKLPENKRSEDLVEKIKQFKSHHKSELAACHSRLSLQQKKLDTMMRENIIEVKNRIYSGVMIQFSQERLMTKREHSPSRVLFDGYEIKIDPMKTKKKTQQPPQ